jgi:hypothetical protein
MPSVTTAPYRKLKNSKDERDVYQFPCFWREITLGSYGIGMMLKRKTAGPDEPAARGIVLVIAFLLLTGVSYKVLMPWAPTASAICSPRRPSVWLCPCTSR